MKALLSLRVVLAASLVLGFACCSDSTGPDPWDRGDILVRLNALPGVQAQEILPHWGYPRAFQLDITQPIDHDRPNAGSFIQRAYLSFVADSTPMVFAPSGYGTSPQSGQELAGILQTNCLSVTHRYFPEARPSNPDWSYLTVWQAAQDHHRIVETFKEIFDETWISTGASKGGKTAVFHRRFFPRDVDATVAYVAPFMFSTEDPRFEPYLRATGTEEGRAAIHDFQRRLLERKDELLPVFGDWFTQNGWTYSLPLGPAFESAVVSYEWGFWQRHIFQYAEIPGPAATGEEMVDHLARAVRLHFKDDSYRDYFKAYIYQVYTEIGTAKLEAHHLADLLEEEYLDVRVRYGFPADLEFAFNPETVLDVVEWIEDEGDEIVYIYGEVDPWTAGQVELNGTADAFKVIQPGGDHQVQILDLDQRDLVLQTLEEWLGMDMSYQAGAPALAVPPAAAHFGTPHPTTLEIVGG
jgi:hypothetical protein